MAAIACTPAAPTAKVSACRIDVTGADQNDLTAYDVNLYPTAPELRYYLAFVLGGADLGQSYVFGVDEDGDHEFNSYIFPDDGSWTIELRDNADDSVVASQAVTVS